MRNPPIHFLYSLWASSLSATSYPLSLLLWILINMKAHTQYMLLVISWHPFIHHRFYLPILYPSILPSIYHHLPSFSLILPSQLSSLLLASILSWCHRTSSWLLYSNWGHHIPWRSCPVPLSSLWSPNSLSSIFISPNPSYLAISSIFPSLAFPLVIGI